MFCISCGAKLPSSAAFCPECGVKIGGSPASAGGQVSETEQHVDEESALSPFERLMLKRRKTAEQGEDVVKPMREVSSDALKAINTSNERKVVKMETNSLPKFCCQCGNRLPSNAAFCPICGKKIDLGCGAGREVPLDSVQPEAHEKSSDLTTGNLEEDQHRGNMFMAAKICAVTLFSALSLFAFVMIVKIWWVVEGLERVRTEGEMTRNIIVTIALLLLVLLGYLVINRKYFKKGK